MKSELFEKLLYRHKVRFIGGFMCTWRGCGKDNWPVSGCVLPAYTLQRDSRKIQPGLIHRDGPKEIFESEATNRKIQNWNLCLKCVFWRSYEPAFCLRGLQDQGILCFVVAWSGNPTMSWSCGGKSGATSPLAWRCTIGQSGRSQPFELTRLAGTRQSNTPIQATTAVKPCASHWVKLQAG